MCNAGMPQCAVAGIVNNLLTETNRQCMFVRFGDSSDAPRARSPSTRAVARVSEKIRRSEMSRHSRSDALINGRLVSQSHMQSALNWDVKWCISPICFATKIAGHEDGLCDFGVRLLLRRRHCRYKYIGVLIMVP